MTTAAAATPLSTGRKAGAAKPRAVHHFGPDIAYAGGMGSVIRVLTEHRVGAAKVVAHPTWRPNSRTRNTDLAITAARQIAGLEKSEIVHIHLAENGSFAREGALVAWARMHGNATVATIHGSGFLPFAHRHPRFAACVLRRAHVITCLDSEVVSLARDFAPGAQVELVPNPIAVEKDYMPAGQADEVVLFAGLVGLRKGIDVLSRAWELVASSRRDARCIIVGPAGDYAVPSLERLELRPPAPRDEIRRLIRSARVVALPSRAEGMPMFLTEAMSAGRPFVSTPVGGIPQLADHGGGLLAEVGDHVALAQHIVGLLADPAAATTIGDKGRLFCIQTRSVEVLDARFAELYAAAGERSTRSSTGACETRQRA